jgi:hypothetical protein
LSHSANSGLKTLSGLTVLVFQKYYTKVLRL